jgi:beta-glucosidase
VKRPPILEAWRVIARWITAADDDPPVAIASRAPAHGGDLPSGGLCPMDRMGMIARFRWATGIEDTFIAQEAPGRRSLDEYELLQHYRLWRDDIDLVAEIGFDSMRYGIPWYRVEPAPGRFDWSFTDRVVPYLHGCGIEPIIDLIHYGTPTWLEGAFVNRDYPERVAAYAAAFADRYRDLVREYTPLNEPFINAELCGSTGRWPPSLEGDAGFTRIVAQLARGIILTQRAVREVRSDAAFVHVEATGCGTTDEDALAERLAVDTERAHAAIELVRGGVQGGSTLHRYLIANGLDERELEWFRDNAVEPDVVGVNYYPYMSVWRRRSENGAVLQEAVWGGAAWLEHVIRSYHERYGRPIFVTECSFNERAGPGSSFGVPDYPVGTEDGGGRSRWLEEAVAVLRRLRAEGMPLIGFCWWPLYDLVNWDYREGDRPAEDYLEPMGLYALRPRGDGTLHRDRLPVADRMREIIATWTEP